MPAAVLLLDGSKVRSQFWLESAVSRIGSHIDADVSIPNSELEDLVALLEYSNGTYQLHNQTKRTFRLGNSTLGPRSSARWSPEVQLSLSEDTALKLVAEDDNRPNGPPQNPGVEEYDGGDDLVDGDGKRRLPEDETPSKSVQLVQLAVIGLCLAGIAGIVAVKFLGIELPAQDTARKVTITEIMSSIDTQAQRETSSESVLMLTRLKELIRLGELKRNQGVGSTHYPQIQKMLPILRDKKLLTDDEIGNVEQLVSSRLKSSTPTKD